MIRIYMANVNSIIQGLKPSQELELSNQLSYITGGFGAPTEQKSLYDSTKKTTYTGLVPRVIQYLKKRKIQYEVIDKRTQHPKNANFSIKEEFKMRDYQQEIVERASSREIIQAATGAGKTFIMSNLIVKFNVKPIIVIAPKVSLAEQIKEEFEKFMGIEIGIVGGGQHEVKDITVCTPMSAPKDLLESAKAILFDECMKYDTKVLMADGSYEKIGDLVKTKSTKKVMSYNHDTNKIEPKKIISHSETPLSKNNKKLMKLTIKKSDGTKEVIECTDNHQIWVESLGKYVKAGDLIKGQKIKTLKNKER